MPSVLTYNQRPALRLTRRLLGDILLDGEFVSHADLQAGIERQKNTNIQLGEILIGMGVLDPVELKAVLCIQKDLVSLEDAVKVSAGVRMLLGELLIKAKRLTREQLDIALREQRRTNEKLGEVLVRFGLLRENELDTMLAFQRYQGGEAPTTEKLRLGELLVATEQITREQLEDVLNRQKLSKKKIGELLIEAGYVQSHQVDHALKLQQKLVTAALVAALALSNAVGVRLTYGGTPALSAKINITARVLEHASMQVLNQVNEFVVTNTDISRGYVDVPAASRISIKTNNRDGCLLAFEMMDDPGALFSSVLVRADGREVQLSSGRGWIQQPYMQGGMIHDISYRFALSKNARPGTYNWPLSISVLPLGR
jgi:hypothetical protein